MMETYIIARIVHVIGVVLWIGGVAMVTTVIIPAIKKMKSNESPMEIFEKVESLFGWQARITTLSTGLSGFYMLFYLDAWHRYTEIQFWWIQSMTIVWVIFTVVLFFLEPFFLKDLFKKHVQKDPLKTLNFVHRLHWVLLILSLVTIAGAVSGSHGWFLF